MEEQTAQYLKQLILNEIAFRKEFKETRDKLESLVSPISKHNKECCLFWEQNLKQAQEVMVIMDNGLHLKLVKPKREDASVESYLPYGIDFVECETIIIK